MHRSIRCALVASLLLAPAFAGAQDAAPQPETAPTAAATTEATASDAPAAEAAVSTTTDPNSLIAAPPAGKGQVVFFREKKFAGSAVRYKVREGESELGKLSSGVYFVHVAEPGTHMYTVHSEAKDVLTLEIEPGETYYVQGGITMGVLVGRPNLTPADVAVFNAMAPKLKKAQ